MTPINTNTIYFEPNTSAWILTKHKFTQLKKYFDKVLDEEGEDQLEKKALFDKLKEQYNQLPWYTRWVTDFSDFLYWGKSEDINRYWELRNKIGFMQRNGRFLNQCLAAFEVEASFSVSLEDFNTLMTKVNNSL